MTQDVQPLTWQKRTNLEEHQQFFSKINEIIDNLAPTVAEAEAAIAQATAAIASANDAIATANAASAAASAAASQAQTAASTVAGYDSRLTTDEGNIAANAAGITALQGRMGTAEGKITAIEGREADYLKKTGAAQTVTSQIMVPTTATGTRDTQIANGTRIQNDLDAYEAMIRTTGNQGNVTGFKGFKSSVSVPPAIRSANDAASLIMHFASPNASTNYVIDVFVSNKRSLCGGRFVITTAVDRTIASVAWQAGFATGTPRCKLGAYTESGNLYVTIAGTEGGSYNAVGFFGMIVGDGYPLTPTYDIRELVTPAADYQSVVIS